MITTGFRIGNFLQDQKGRLCIVDELTSDNDDFYAKAINDSITNLPNKPIKITESYLVGLGFEKKKQPGRLYDYYYIKNGFYFSFIDFHKVVYKNNALEEVDCTYVHQLQNLYYRLSGEELEYKPL